MSAYEVIYKSADGLYENKAEVLVSKAGVGEPLKNVNRVVCYLYPSGEVVDSDESVSAITWAAAGSIIFDFNEHSFDAVPSGSQAATLIAYDPAHPDGQVLAHRTDDRLGFEFVS